MVDVPTGSGAWIDATQRYRYLLWRSVEDDGLFATGDVQRLLWVLLNPSTDDAVQDDATIRRLRGFARHWSLGFFEVVYLFAFRATDPAALRDCADPVDSENDEAIAVAARRSDLVVCGWGDIAISPPESSSPLDRFARHEGLQNLAPGRAAPALPLDDGQRPAAASPVRALLLQWPFSLGRNFCMTNPTRSAPKN